MQASWNQWGNSVGSGVGNYAANYPGSVPSSVGNFPSLSSSNPFPIPVTSALNNPAVTSALSSPYPIGNAIYGQHSQQQQQQWQQWEQWQQQYAQWHQQYGDKYQGPVPTPGILSSGTSFPPVPPLPQSAPIVQPPPPDSVPPPSEKNGDSGKRSLPDSSGKDETKKLKLGKSSKSENVEDLIEQEKTFDAQFKSWEASFLKWKEQNANHPDKTQYKEYEAKWESWREQLLQKREQLRKKRENKEVEVAAAAAAAKEAALATSNVSTLSQPNYNSGVMNPSNPYGSMYSVPGVYPPPDMISGPPTTNYVSNYSIFNVPPPPNMPQISSVTSIRADSQNMPKLGDGTKSTPSLEFLSAVSSNVKSIPGLDLAGADKTVNPPFPSTIPSNSTLFSYNQDVTKPLHTSDDKPFNFPAPPQSSFINDSQSPFGRGRAPCNSFDNDGLPFGRGRAPSNSFDKDGQSPFGRGRAPGNSFDKDGQSPFGRGRAPSNSFDSDGQSSFGRGRVPSNTFDHFAKNSRFPQFDGPPRSNQSDRNSLFDDRSGGGGFARDFDSRFSSDFKFSGRNTEFRSEPPEKSSNKFGNSSYTSNFSTDKFAKYLEDEYDDSRFRDPEPPNDNQQFSNNSNYHNRDSNSAGHRQTFGRPDNSYAFDDRGRNNFDRNKSVFDKNRPDSRFESFGRNNKSNQFKRGPPENTKDAFSRNEFGRGNCDSKATVSATSDRNSLISSTVQQTSVDFNSNFRSQESNRPVSLLDLPIMKPPETFDKMNPPSEISDVPPPSEDALNPYPLQNRLPLSKNETDQNTVLNKEMTLSTFSTKSVANSDIVRDSSNVNESTGPMPSENIQPYVPLKIFEYDHVSRNGEDGKIGTFEPVYIFDYSHGKRKVNDYGSESTAPSIDFKKQNKLEESIWGEGSWDEIEIREKTAPLPPRSRHSPLHSNKMDDIDVLKNAVEKVVHANLEGIPAKTDVIESQLLIDKMEENQRSNDSRKNDSFASSVEEKHSIKLINDILCPPGRLSRPMKLVVIMRGAPGSGKTFTAKFIKDKEVEMGGSAPRILSLDDYFTVENDVKLTDPVTGKITTKKEMQYEYDAALESSYQESLMKSFKKTISDGFFPFIIVDCVNDKVKKYEEMYNFAKSKGFQVFICEMDQDVTTCSKRNIHSRSENDIANIIDAWEKTPLSQTLLDVRSLLQSATTEEVVTTDTEESSRNTENVLSKDENKNEEGVEAQITIAEEKTKENSNEEEDQATNENETNSMASVRSDPAPVLRSGFGYQRRARATFRGIPRMPRPQGNYQFQERRGFGGPTWRRGWPSRR